MRHVDAFSAGRLDDVAGLLRETDGWARAVTEAVGELEEERLAGADPSGTVRAEVSGAGRLRTLSIDPRGLRALDHVQLARAVREAIVAAHLAMDERLTEVVQTLTRRPSDTTVPADPLAGHIRDVLRGE
ncbi:YbaB/EbfC family nucleoid-associated protein [Nonomuraea diastatica]|uniref:YbaB/EbfC family DNA-binding protein n=1 Tax=Nonomuraea diastatica TaxID=1848329 RepID=A0A4R4W8Y6_9ACTN|nr:YbaB/EbfC family nucleoid-associated protein [Nonomuraea diastatica]TDD14541.1 YbaB/EbfC family DNA-binding protein [Nonomuraea diastatica]